MHRPPAKNGNSTAARFAALVLLALLRSAMQPVAPAALPVEIGRDHFVVMSGSATAIEDAAIETERRQGAL